MKPKLLDTRLHKALTLLATQGKLTRQMGPGFRQYIGLLEEGQRFRYVLNWEGWAAFYALEQGGGRFSKKPVDGT